MAINKFGNPGSKNSKQRNAQEGKKQRNAKSTKNLSDFCFDFLLKLSTDVELLRLISTSKTFFSGMAGRSRYFDNAFGDGWSPVQVDREHWIRQAQFLAQDIQKNRRHVLESVDGGLYVGPGSFPSSIICLLS